MENNQITITKGIVTKIETKSGGDGFVVIERISPNEFFTAMGSESHGGGQQTGNLKEVLSGFHEEVSKGYERLFSLANPNKETLSRIGFSDYKLLIK